MFGSAALGAEAAVGQSEQTNTATERAAGARGTVTPGPVLCVTLRGYPPREPGTTVTYQAPNGRDMTVDVVAVEPFVP